MGGGTSVAELNFNWGDRSRFPDHPSAWTQGKYTDMTARGEVESLGMLVNILALNGQVVWRLKSRFRCGVASGKSYK